MARARACMLLAHICAELLAHICAAAPTAGSHDDLGRLAAANALALSRGEALQSAMPNWHELVVSAPPPQLVAAATMRPVRAYAGNTVVPLNTPSAAPAPTEALRAPASLPMQRTTQPSPATPSQALSEAAAVRARILQRATAGAVRPAAAAAHTSAPSQAAQSDRGQLA